MIEYKIGKEFDGRYIDKIVNGERVGVHECSNFVESEEEAAISREIDFIIEKAHFNF